MKAIMPSFCQHFGCWITSSLGRALINSISLKSEFVVFDFDVCPIVCWSSIMYNNNTLCVRLVFDITKTTETNIHSVRFLFNNIVLVAAIEVNNIAYYTIKGLHATKT